MTVTATALKKKDIKDNLRIVEGTFAFDNSYPTGGETLTGLAAELERASVVVFSNTAGYYLDWDAANQKVIAYYGNYDAADGVLIQVPNTTDLSAVTGVRFIAFGS